jgi:hypothetical protein
MKRISFGSLVFLLIFFVTKVNSQTVIPTSTVESVTPGGIFDMIYDHYGNQYSLADLNVDSPKPIGGGNTVQAVPTLSCNAGYFDLYFAPSSIFATSASANTVVCQVFTDISGFISSALSTTPGVGPRLRIYCGNYVGIDLLAQASSFYAFPSNPSNSNQGLIDGLIYKGLTTGQDPYSTLPVTFSVNSSTANFYHGYVQANPNGYTGTTPNSAWHYNINSMPTNGFYDFYSVIFHEVVHALGVQSLIHSTGYSTIGQNNNYYSRYDKFLFDYTGTPLLTSTVIGCPNISLVYTSSLAAICPSLCVASSTIATPDITTCSVAVQYSSSTTNIKVYTPNCWEPASSLSHFEDMCNTNTFTPTAPNNCTPTPSSPGVNNLYFSMSNSIGWDPCYVKRYLKEEERLVLCNLGYSVAGVYSSVSGALISGASNSHTYSTFCTPTIIYGLNDGISNGIYTFTTNTNALSIPTSSLLQNDFPSSGLTVSCVEVIYSNSTTSVTASVSGTTLNVTALSGSGLALLKYYPLDGSGNYGNATYVFIYFLSNNCNPTNACNMVQNGGFESLVSTMACGIMSMQTGPIISCWENQVGNPAVLSRSCTSGSVYNLNVNTVGSAPYVMNSFNGTGNDRVVALHYSPINIGNTQAIKNNLSSALVPNSIYKISLMVANVTSSLTGNNTTNHPVVITIASNTVYPFFSSSFPSTLNVIAQFTVPASNSWTQVSQTFTFTGPVNHSALLIGINATATIAQGTLTPPNGVTCYIDEVSLIPQPSPTFNLGNLSICGNTIVPNLDQFTSNPSIGTFSGTGVTFNGSTYDFNLTSTLSPGIYPIAYTYTTNGSGGCTHTLHSFVTVSTNTNLLVLNPINLCASPHTLNLTTLITNTNFISGTTFSVNGITSGTQYTFTTLGIHTISATNSSTNLCSNTVYTTTAMVYTATPTPTMIIGGNTTYTAEICNGTTIQLASASAGSFQIWQPGNLSGSPQNFTPSVTTIYTLTTYDYSVCPSSHTAEITVLNLVSKELCITNPTLNLNSLISNSVFVGTGTFSVYNSTYTNNAPSNSFTFPSTGFYTVTLSHTLCSSTQTTLVKVYSVPTTPTVSAITNTVCSGSAITFSINSSLIPVAYSLVPGNSSFASTSNTTYTFIPTSSGVYSVLGVNAPCASVSSNTINITVDPATCLCNSGCNSILGGTITSSPPPFQTYCVTSDLYVSGAITFSNSDFKISPGVTITIATGGTLTIAGSHLFACQNMWQGIVVKQKGALNILASSIGTTSLFEDAKIAVNVRGLTNPHPFAGITGEYILFADQVTFNRNQVSIKIESLAMNTGTNNACIIKNSLFTSRSIPSYSLTWPTTTAIKNSSSGATSPLATPWIDDVTYPATKLKAPFASDFPSHGIYLSYVGNTSMGTGTAAAVGSYTSMLIGETGATNFNMFDNLYNGINLLLSNAKIINSVFQNPRGLCRSLLVDPPVCDIGGTGIVASSPWTDNAPFRNSLEVVPGISGSNTYSNYFYDMTTAIDVNNYLYSKLSQNKIVSISNSYPQSSWDTPNDAPANFGSTGIKIKTHSFQYLYVEENVMHNIKNNVLFTVTEGGNDFVPNGTYGRYIGQAYIQRNFMSLHPSTPVANEYINIGVSMDDPVSAPGYTPNYTSIAAVTPSISISSNTIVNAHNGISVNSFYGNPVHVTENVISLKNEPTTVVSNPVQNGILSLQMQSANIHLNNISGPSTYPAQNAIMTDMNSLLSLQCNKTEYCYRGIVLNGAQAISRFEDNTMENETIGLHLNNFAKITAANSTIAVATGTNTWPTNNEWLGSWGGSNSSSPWKTYVSPFSNAQNAKLWIQYNIYPFDPNGNGYSPYLTQNYYHNSTVGTLLSGTTSLTGCRIGLTPPWGRITSSDNKWNDFGLVTMKFLEELVIDGIFNPENMSDNEYIEKTLVYRTIKHVSAARDSSGILNNFFTNCDGNSIQVFCDIESNLAKGEYEEAQEILNSIVPNKDIESNYLEYYRIFIKSKTENLDGDDLSSLDNLVGLCPYLDGAIVYQARAFYNSFYNTYITYTDECSSGGAKIGKNENSESKIDLILKSTLFPNPNYGNFRIRFNVYFKKQQVEVKIADLSGRLIVKERMIIDETNEITINRNLTNGTYIVKVFLPDGTYDRHRLIINK